ncbi:hypothetical protein [Bradyrhizobium sp. Ash2021]|uniref:hypothetical protein n=1 Tax=Bradyrhizobium sp. Ash2021 TaxID=2954771 RepID=UPI0028151C2B|nr:hypothetical protein [Bradyrhizobium sp. Ash2021]WMT77463.1 hypothetical protein NL528_14385 [Bradyrhizobium sp. Ash2021]
MDKPWLGLYRRPASCSDARMEQNDERIDRILEEVARLRERVNSIPTVAEISWFVIGAATLIVIYRYFAH